MSQRIFFFPGMLNHQYVADVIKEAAVTCPAVIVPEIHFRKWKNAKIETDVIDLHALTRTVLFDHNLLSHTTSLKDLFDNVFNDSRAYYLIERLYTFSRDNSVFNKSADIYILLLNTVALIDKYRPDAFVLPATPHTLEWYMAKCAEFLNIRVVYVSSTPLHWKRLVACGLDRITVLDNASNDSDQQKVNDWLATFQQGYNAATPPYERKRNAAFAGGDSKLHLHVLDILKAKTMRLKYLKLTSLKVKLDAIKCYESKTSGFTFPDKFVALFLHYQPERTSLPEGLGYAQQMRLILEVLAMLPDDYTLVVREHPAMFRNMFSRKAREKCFYEKVASLPNVLLAPLDLTPFDLIEKASGTVTLTGLVAVESVIKNTPALCYGRPIYYDMPGVYLASDRASLEAFYSNLKLAPKKDILQTEIDAYFKKLDSISYSSDDTSVTSAPSFRALVQACKWQCRA